MYAGTLWAIFTSGSVYFLIIVVQAGSFPREWLVSDLSSFQNATVGSRCGIHSMLCVMMDIQCKCRYIIVAGILIAAYSSALGAIFGGSRLLQAISRDGLFPLLKPFAFGAVKGDEPRYDDMT
jgi:amino acid transporter